MSGGIRCFSFVGSKVTEVSAAFDMRILVNQLRFFFFQAEDGIRDLVRSRGLGDVYKRQASVCSPTENIWLIAHLGECETCIIAPKKSREGVRLSLIHI